MKRNNRGFSLVEIIVVVAILGALTGLISLSVSSVFSVRARRCASEINSYISMCKVNCMSRAGDINIILDVDGDGSIRGRYYEAGTLKDTAVFSDSRVSAAFTVDGTVTTLSPTDTLTLSFNRSTGGFKPYSESGGVKSYCSSLSVTCGKTYVITLVPSTGSHTIG